MRKQEVRNKKQAILVASRQRAASFADAGHRRCAKRPRRELFDW